MQRNTTETAIQNLSAGDISAKDAKAQILSTIPAPEFRERIPFAMVKRSRALNIRDEASYGYVANKELWDSLDEFGLQMRNPMMSFSEQSDGSLLTISGNLRGEAMEGLNTRDAEQRAKDGLPIAPPRFEYIHGLVWRGLSREQEIALVTDQTLSRGLNEFEIAKAIGELWEVNPKMTDAKMSIFWGMDKNKVRRLRMRYCMPTVFGEYRKEKDKSYTGHYAKVGNVALDALYTAYLADREAGNAHREEGPAFHRAWKVFQENPENFGKKETPKDEPKKGQTEESVKNQAGSCVTGWGDGPEILAIRDTLLWALGEPGPTGPVNLNTVRTDVKNYVDGLRSQLEANAISMLETDATVANLTTERDNLIVERDNLIAERDSLKVQAENKRKVASK